MGTGNCDGSWSVDLLSSRIRINSQIAENDFEPQAPVTKFPITGFDLISKPNVWRQEEVKIGDGKSCDGSWSVEFLNLVEFA